MRALLIAFVVGCQPRAAPKPFTLRIAVWGTLEAPAPDRNFNGWTSFAVSLVFEPLVTNGEHGEVVPVLASRVEREGPRSLRLWLRPGATFSDGSAVSLTEISTSLAESHLAAAPEGDHLLVSSADAGAPVEVLLARASIAKRTKVGWLGTGAFVVSEQDAQHILLSRRLPQPRSVTRVRLDSYPTPQDAFARTLKGDADMLPDVQQRWLEFFEGVPRLRILRGPGPSANMVAFNLQRLRRADRLALAKALASDELRTLAFGEECVPPSRRPAFEPLVAGKTLQTLATPNFDRFAHAVRRTLGARAGTVDIVDVEHLLARVSAGDFDLAALRPRLSPPIASALVWRTGAAGNLFHYSNPAVDAAIDARDWNALEKALADDPPGAIICTPPAIVVLDSRIKNAELGISFKESLPQWEVVQ